MKNTEEAWVQSSCWPKQDWRLITILGYSSCETNTLLSVFIIVFVCNVDKYIYIFFTHFFLHSPIGSLITLQQSGASFVSTGSRNGHAILCACRGEMDKKKGEIKRKTRHLRKLKPMKNNKQHHENDTGSRWVNTDVFSCRLPHFYLSLTLSLSPFSHTYTDRPLERGGENERRRGRRRKRKEREARKKC